ncbi:MAG: type II toxin-antitoxin system RelE/ParE family toxin [Planctomycetota bacterium]
MNQLRLTERALSDLDEIESYSVSRWGREVADKYIADLGAALDRLSQDLSLFRERHDYTGRLRFYSVREHVLVGDVIGRVGFVLTVWHGAMDFFDRLADIEPDLMREAAIMAKQIERELGRPRGSD